MSRARDIADTGDNNLDDIVVDGSGNVGIGTSSPSAGAVGGKVVHVQNSGGTASVRVDRSDASTAGTLSMTSGNTTNGLYGTGAKPMVFSTNATERMLIGANGHLYATCNDGSLANLTLRNGASGDTPDFLQCRDSANNAELVIEPDGDVKNANNVYGALSDAKLKENIINAPSQWDDIKALQIRKYNLIGNEQVHIGVVAQELEAAGMSGLVSERIDFDEDGNDLGTTTKSVKYSILHTKALKALQEAMERIEELEARIAALENA